MDFEHHINYNKPRLFGILKAMALVLAHLHEHASPHALALAIVLFLIAVHFATSTSRAERLLRKLPSPRFKLPIIGHLHLVGPLPHVSLRELARKHGPDVMLLRLGAVPALIVSSPRAAKAILRTHDHLFASRPSSAVGEILFSGSTNVANAPYGDYWREIRKIVTTHLLTTNKIRSNLASREQEVRLVLTEVREAAAAGTAVDLSELLSSFAHHVEIQTVLGRLPREAGWSKQFHELLEGNSKLLGGFNWDDYFPGLARLDMVSAKAAKHKKRWDDLLDDLIERHASKPVEEDDDKDFIDVLLSVQVQQEYSLKAVMKETLRLHPPGPLMVPHFSMADCDVHGYTIPSGTRAIVNVWALGRDTSCWENAEEFMPERFMEEAMDAASDFHGNDFRFLPFGSGRRMCPGVKSVTVTFELIMANLMYHFNWELPKGSPGIDMTEVFGLDVHRKDNLLLVPCVAQHT